MVVRGVTRESPAQAWGGGVLFVAAAAFWGFVSFWGEMLWFESAGYESRFWTAAWAQLICAGTAALGSAAIVWALGRLAPRRNGIRGHWAEGLALLAGGGWGYANWTVILRYLNGVSTDVTEPILGLGTGFYLFTVPFLDALYGLFFLLACLTALKFLSQLVRPGNQGLEVVEFPGSLAGPLPGPLFAAVGMILFALGVGRFLDVLHLMYSPAGVVFGPGWTDVHVRLPVFVGLGLLFVGMACVFFVPALRERIHRRFATERFGPDYARFSGIATPVLGLFAMWIAATGLAPVLFQWLRVSPNEITLEEPYIENNIQFTRLGFHLGEVEPRQFPASGELTESVLETNDDLLSEIRLWDWRALLNVYHQFQEIRLYYEFSDIDIDRYRYGGGYHQVMVSPREMEQDNLPSGSQTFINKRFKYTHGYGMTLNPVSEFTDEGLPNLLVKDIPPEASYDKLRVERPEIYYGELTDSPVVVNTNEPEFDYPSGDENRYTKYSGSGGVQLTNPWRKFVFGWKFDGTRFLLSSYPTDESRILFRRQIRERVQALAPFLRFDVDPYIVVSEGKLYWIIDAYTSSEYFPYSEKYSSREVIEYSEGEAAALLTHQTVPYLDGQNYVRNSVKAVVNAFDGSVDFYIYDPDDPLIQVWSRIFPGMFAERSQMPAGLQRHVRYPHDYLLVQGLVYAKYHMTDPAVFYNQEDLWVRATEKYRAGVEPVEPYHVMWKSPGSGEPEFTVILPFTPKNRQVLVGWMAGLSDGDNYGRLLIYKFPKERRVLGPQQMETKIDQDSYLSERLTLWDQRGSSVIRGNVLAIPIDDTLLYVEPIYLQAETAAYPELRLVAVMHNDNLSYAPTFDEALRGLLEPAEAPAEGAAISERRIPRGGKELIQEAQDAFESYLRLQGQKRFGEAADELERLQDALEALSAGDDMTD